MDGGVTLITLAILKLGVIGGTTIAITTAFEWFHGYKRKPKKGVAKNDGDEIEFLRQRAKGTR